MLVASSVPSPRHRTRLTKTSIYSYFTFNILVKYGRVIFKKYIFCYKMLLVLFTQLITHSRICFTSMYVILSGSDLVQSSNLHLCPRSYLMDRITIVRSLNKLSLWTIFCYPRYQRLDLFNLYAPNRVSRHLSSCSDREGKCSLLPSHIASLQ